VERLVVMEELEAVEELDPQDTNLLMRSSAGGVARVIVLEPPIVAVSYREACFQRIQLLLLVMLL